MTSKIYTDWRGHRVEMLSETDGTALFCSEGGGFQRRMPMEAFTQEFNLETAPPSFKLTAVSAEWLEKDAPCYSDGTHWNGWEKPHFTLEVAMSIIHTMPDLVYVAEKDVFVNLADLSDVEVFTHTWITVGVQSIKVYPLGAGCWCWEAPSPAPKLPPDPDGMNDERAGLAKSAMDALPVDGDVPAENRVRDLLCNLHHWCDRNGIDFDSIAEEAEGSYRSETAS